VAAAQYAQHRPGYAEAAIRWCLAPVSGAQAVRMVNLGAGTGILTGALARLGADVVAVEPDQAMLAELGRQLRQDARHYPRLPAPPARDLGRQVHPAAGNRCAARRAPTLSGSSKLRGLVILAPTE
jgi:SAM-dependent methyltransferase